MFSLLHPENLNEWCSFYSNLVGIANSQSDSLEKRGILATRFNELCDSRDFEKLSKEEVFAYMMLVTSSISQTESNKLIITYSKILNLYALIMPTQYINAGRLLDPETLLNRYLIAPASKGNGLYLDTALKLRNGLLARILGGEAEFGPAAYVVLNDDFFDDNGKIIGKNKLIDSASIIYTHMQVAREHGVICIHGQAGCGRGFIFRHTTLALSKRPLVISVSALLSFDEAVRFGCINEILLRCIFDDYIPCLSFDNINIADIKDANHIISAFMRDVDIIFALAEQDILADMNIRGAVHLLNLDAPKKKYQQEFWYYFAKKIGVCFDDSVDLIQLTSVFDLTPDKIKKILLCAKSQNPTADCIDITALQQQIRQLCSTKINMFATKLESKMTFDDIQLPERSKKLIMEAIDRVRYRSVVNEDYGFGKKLPYGNGLVIAFCGPSGTGKTMTATVIANELGLDIYRIDLSQITSKYIGESEKNLSSLFEAARYSNAILFFDEADALFSKRTDVSTSNDKHANSEVAFLLQKMEEYSGISIMATNVLNNFDNAFRRRITYVIPIDKPDKDIRLKIWQNVFPKETPLADDIDFEKLAEKADITGSGIKAAAISASYHAAAEGKCVNYSHICMAVDEEYKKLGHTSIMADLL